jgi:hypothetical protein
MKQDKNKPTVTKAVIQSISLLDSENSDNLAYTTQGRVLKSMCYSLTNDLRFVNSTYTQAFAEWGVLKEDSRGDESTAVAISKKERYLHDLECQADDLQEMKDEMYEAHLKFFGIVYVPQPKGSKKQVTRSEIDSSWSPKARK